MNRYLLLAAVLLSFAACSGPPLPPPNSVDAHYDGSGHAVQVLVSSLQPASEIVLVSPEGARFQASGMSLISAPHVLYNAPPSIGFGIGGFGFTGCCSGIGSGVGVGVPLGRPTLAEASDQYVASALVAVPADYAARWSSYRLQVSIGGQLVELAAPPPA
jgi:hypothetical protein